MKYKMTVLFWLRKNQRNAKNEAVINCRITINGIRANDFTTNVFTTADLWDSKKQKIKDDIKQSVLQSIRQKLSAIHLDFELKDIPVTAKLLKDIYTKKETLPQRITVTKLFDDFFINEKRKIKKPSKIIPYYERRSKPFFFLSLFSSPLFRQNGKFHQKLKTWQKQVSSSFLLKERKTVKQGTFLYI